MLIHYTPVIIFKNKYTICSVLFAEQFDRLLDSNYLRSMKSFDCERHFSTVTGFKNSF